MDLILNNKPYLMFHEVLDNWTTESGFHLRNKGKYTITCEFFNNILKKYGDSVNYTFDDGGISNLYAANQLKFCNIKGIFFICTALIGKPGFLNLEEIKEIAQNHFVFAHGHNHIQKKENLTDVESDWRISLGFMKTNCFSSEILCLPAGYYTKTHNRIFKELKVKYIFHSAPSNIVLNFLYQNDIVFIPRIIITNNFNYPTKFNYVGVKSIIKQVFDFLN